MLNKNIKNYKKLSIKTLQKKLQKEEIDNVIKKEIDNAIKEEENKSALNYGKLTEEEIAKEIEDNKKYSKEKIKEFKICKVTISGPESKMSHFKDIPTK